MKEITERQLMEECATLRNEFGSVKEKLVPIKKELTRLNRKINRLYKDIERILIESHGAKLNSVFNNLEKCLGTLIRWSRVRDSVSEAFNALPGKWGA